MKNIRYFLLLAMTMLFAACTQDIEEIEPSVPQEGGQDGKLVEIIVSMDARDTRVEYHEESPNFTWDAGDELLVLGYNASNTCQFAETFTMKEGTNTGNSATFVGILRTADKIKVFYKAPNLSYNVEEADGGVKIDYSGQKQVGKDSSAHLKPYLLIGTADYTTNAQLMSGNLALTMLNSLLRVDVKSMPYEIYPLNNLEVVSNFGTETEKSTSIKVEGYTADDGAAVLYMAFDPATMTQNATNSLRLAFGGKRHHYVQADNTKATLNQSGRRYRLTVAETAEELKGGKGLTNWAVESIRVRSATHTIMVFHYGSVTPELIDQAMNGTGKLKVVGGINGADLKAIRERAGAAISYDSWDGLKYPAEEGIKLFELDFSETTFVPSGGSETYFKNFSVNRTYYIKEVSKIPASAFCGSRLKSIILPKSAEITTIGDLAFEETKDLTTLVFPKNITTLELGCFYHSMLTNITLPPTITTVQNEVFRSCTSLETVNWNASCPVIPTRCFDETYSLTALNIAEGVTTIESMALANMQDIRTLVLPRSTTQILSLPQLTSLTVKAPYSQDFKMVKMEDIGYGGEKICDLTLDGSWAPYVNGNEWNGATWKSIAYIGEVDSSPRIILTEAEKTIEAARADLSFTFTITQPTTAQPTIEAQTDATWLKNVQLSYDNGNGTVNYSVEANEAKTPRQATITVKYEGAEDKVYTIKQEGKPLPSIVLTSPQKRIGKESANLSFTFEVKYPTTAQPTIEIQPDVTWLKDVQLSYDNGNGTVNYSVDANEGETLRQATITVKYEGAKDLSVTLVQSGNTQTSAKFSNTSVLVNMPKQQMSGATYETLVKFDQFNSNQTIIGQEGCFLMRVGDDASHRNKVEVCVGNLDERGNGTEEKLKANSLLNAGQWYHLAATLEPTTSGVKVTLYINGVQDAQQTFNLQMPELGGDGQPLKTDQYNGTSSNYGAKRGIFIGRLLNFKWGERPMAGMMCETRVWSVARTSNEIASNIFSITSATDALEAYYKFDGTDISNGTTVNDASGKGHNGKVTGTLEFVEHDIIKL